jgi:prepilin-type N-terminal cleavage/methylation domain-containing protein
MPIEQRRPIAAPRASRRTAFTLVELLVVIAIIATLVGILLPAIQGARETARRTQCLSRTRQVALAVLVYHDARNRFPEGMIDAINDISTGYRICWMHHLLPFLEEEPLYDQLKPQMDALIPNSFGMQRVEGRNTVVGELVCPSNPGGARTNTPAGDGAGSQGFFGNYVLCAGSRAYGTKAQSLEMNGIFFPRSRTKIKDVLDGLTHTLMVGELIVVPKDAGDTAACAYWGAMDYRGSYYNSVHGGALFTTLNPPNSSVPDYLWEACANYPAGSAQPKTPCGGCTDRNRNNVGGRSMHAGGMNVALGDASARFVDEAIDLQVWQALGTRAGGEVVGEF